MIRNWKAIHQLQRGIISQQSQLRMLQIPNRLYSQQPNNKGDKETSSSNDYESGFDDLLKQGNVTKDQRE